MLGAPRDVGTVRRGARPSLPEKGRRRKGAPFRAGVVLVVSGFGGKRSTWFMKALVRGGLPWFTMVYPHFEIQEVDL